MIRATNQIPDKVGYDKPDLAQSVLIALPGKRGSPVHKPTHETGAHAHCASNSFSYLVLVRGSTGLFRALVVMLHFTGGTSAWDISSHESLVTVGGFRGGSGG